jgi:hypothetical protein
VRIATDEGNGIIAMTTAAAAVVKAVVKLIHVGSARKGKETRQKNEKVGRSRCCQISRFQTRIAT